MTRIGDAGSRQPQGSWLDQISPVFRWLLAAAFLSLMALELARLYLGGLPVEVLANAAVVAIFVLCLPLLANGLRESFFYAGAIAAALAVVWMAVAPEPVFARACAQSGFLMAFILLIGLLREAALTSRSVLACGSYLAGRPQGQRYMSLHTGSHFLGAIINVGAISLLAPLVQRGIRARQAEPDAALLIQEQRQLAATLRGMPWVIVWAPTTLTQAMLPTIIPGIDAPRLFGLGLLTAALVFGLGVLDDRLRWRAYAAKPDKRKRSHAPEPFPGRAFGNFLFVCACLASLAALFVALAGVKVVPALMLAAPIIFVCWLGAQFYKENTAQSAPALRPG